MDVWFVVLFILAVSTVFGNILDTIVVNRVTKRNIILSS